MPCERRKIDSGSSGELKALRRGGAAGRAAAIHGSTVELANATWSRPRSLAAYRARFASSAARGRSLWSGTLTPTLTVSSGSLRFAAMSRRIRSLIFATLSGVPLGSTTTNSSPP